MGRRRFGPVLGDRILPKNTQGTASTTAPFVPEMYEVTPTMGALLRIRGVAAGMAKTVRNENCRLRPYTIAVSDDEGEVKQGDAAALQLRATADEANVTVGNNGEEAKRMSRATKTSKQQQCRNEARRKKTGGLPRRTPQRGAQKAHQGKQVDLQTGRPNKNGPGRFALWSSTSF